MKFTLNASFDIQNSNVKEGEGGERAEGVVCTIEEARNMASSLSSRKERTLDERRRRRRHGCPPLSWLCMALLVKASLTIALQRRVLPVVEIVVSSILTRLLVYLPATLLVSDS